MISCILYGRSGQTASRIEAGVRVYVCVWMRKKGKLSKVQG